MAIDRGCRALGVGAAVVRGSRSLCAILIALSLVLRRVQDAGSVRAYVYGRQGEGLSLLDRAEDPAETLDYSYEKQLEQLQSVKQGIVELVTAKKRLQNQESSIQEQIARLDGQARQAMAAGQEDLARAALERKHLAEGEMQSLDQQVAQLETSSRS